MRTTITFAAVLLAVSSVHAQDFRNVTCEGTYPQHLQGVCADKEAIYWCFTTNLVKTDLSGKLLKKVPVVTHHGDLCFHDGRLYVAVNLGKFNDPQGNADSWVYVYNATDLSFVTKHQTSEVIHGAGGIAFHEGRFLIVGGLPDGVRENNAYEYDANFKFVKKHVLDGGHTEKGIQTAAFADGSWWFGCYGDPKILLKVDSSLKRVERFEFDCSLGILPVGDGKFLIARGSTSKQKEHSGKLELFETDKVRGLIRVPEASPKK